MIESRRPGQPLAVLLGLLGAWAVLRIALWQPPFAVAASTFQPTLTKTSPSAPVSLVAVDRVSGVARSAIGPIERGEAPPASLQTIGHASPMGGARAPKNLSVSLLSVVEAAQVVQSAASLVPAGPRAGPRVLPRSAPIAFDFVQNARLSGDAWLLLRPGSASFAAPLISRYGASQAGAVARYRLSGSAHAPAVYARSSAALEPFADRELALGIAARPIARLPARLQLEVRARDAGHSVGFAPAAIAVSEVGPRSLPFDFVAQPYLAAGYVAGRQATAFVDGSLRIDRKVAELGAMKVRLGIGAWGGAQKGAAALDVGPGLTISADLAGRPLVLSLDYRLRAAGHAEPRSGPALTISSGF